MTTPTDPTYRTNTTCAYCGVGCGVAATPTGSYSAEIAGDPAHPANAGRLCQKGSALGETIDLEGRLLYPQVRGQAVPWDMALDAVAQGFGRALEQYGPDRVAFYVSGQLLTEDYYVANKLMKGYFGGSNIDTNSRLCMSSAVAGYKRAFGNDIVPGNYNDWELADLVVLAGSNTAWCHPILFQRVLAAQRDRPDKRLICIDPRRTATAEQADLHLPIKPGTDVTLFNGLLVWLADNGAADADYLAAHVNGADAAVAAARADAPDIPTVAARCELAEEDVARFYRLFAQTPRTLTVYSQGINQSTSGTDKTNAIINCHLLTGRVGKPGASPFSITGQPNAMGGREVGGLANMLAAHMGFDNPEHPRLVQEFWQSPRIPRGPGFKAVELFDAMYDGYIKAVWIMATNPAVSLPNAGKVAEALKRCEFVVVSDCMQSTDTARHANVLLPALAWGEKDGTVTNSERRISRQRRFMPAAGDARADWQIICDVARRMGHGAGFPYQSAREIFCEHAALSGFRNGGSRDFDISGLAELDEASYDGLQPIQWPVPEAGHAGTARLLGDGRFYTADGRANLLPLATRQPDAAVSSDWPLVLNTGRIRDHWHTLTRSGKSPRLSQHRIEAELDMHPADAEARSLTDGQLVKLESPQGLARLRLRLTDAQRRGEVFMPIHWNDEWAADAVVGRVVNPAVDPLSGEPEFKHTPVQVSAEPVAWYGFALSRQPLPMAGMGHWTRVKGQLFWRYELCGAERPADPETWARQLLGITDVEADWLDYADTRRGAYRAAWLVGGQIEACLFVAPEVNLPDRAWLASLFTAGSIAPADRASLLLGESADPAADVGPLVCACFGVGRNTIANAVAEGCDSAEALGAKLKCGTNCGSCVPELNALIAAGSQQAA